MRTFIKTGTVLALLTFLAGSAHPVSAQSATFNFGGDIVDGVGKLTTFTDTNNGISAQFSDQYDPNIFQVEASFLKNVTGNVLGPGQSGANFVPLDILFSQPINSISLDFLLNGFDTSTLTVATFTGGVINPDGTLGGTAAGTAIPVRGAIPGGNYQYPEGFISFTSASGFNAVEVTSTAQNFAIGNIQVFAPAAVPEASTTLSFSVLLLLGASGWVVSTRRRAVADA